MLSEQNHYELEHIGQSSHEDGPVEFSFVFNNDMIDHEEALERYRRAAINEKVPSESTPHEQQRQQQAALQQPSSQSQLQQQQSQTVVNASNTPINVSYLTDTTESSIATPSSSLTTVSTGEKEIVMTSAVPTSNQETSTSIYFRKNSSTKESVIIFDSYLN